MVEDNDFVRKSCAVYDGEVLLLSVKAAKLGTLGDETTHLVGGFCWALVGSNPPDGGFLTMRWV